MAQMNTMIPKRLCDTTVVTSTTMTLYSNTSGYIGLATELWMHNPHTSTITIQLFRVPDSAGVAGSAAAGNQKLKEALAPGQTLQAEIRSPGWVLEDTADTVQAVASITGYVTISIDGFTVEV